MVRLIVLGSSSLVATEEKRPTHLAFLGREQGLLIDCGVSPRGRLEQLGIGRDAIDDILITHFHPDHAAGLPLYLMELWLRGRRKPLAVHAGEICLDRIRQMLDLYEWQHVPGLFPVDFQPIPQEQGATALDGDEFRVTVCPVRHLVPTLAVRVECRESGRSVVYSSDTEPSSELVALAQGADILLHEATGEGPGHSSAAQAGEAARQAGVRRLILIHSDPYADSAALAAAASAVFPGPVEVATDRMEIPIP
jgi:ribonuclease Z